MFILCFLDLSLSVFALFCVLYGGALALSAMLCFLALSSVWWWWGVGHVLRSFCSLFVVLWSCVFLICLLSGVPLSSLGGAVDLLYDPVFS